MRTTQTGVALIFVLVIFTMITVMAVRIIASMQLNTEKYARHMQYIQARHYAFGAENYIAVLLEQDAQSDKQTNKLIDHWYEPWAEEEVALETEQGEITILTLDDQGRFNLNMLAGKKNDKDKQKMLERLLAAHNIDARLAYRIQDWVDENQDPQPGGAEDNHYLLLDSPYRTGDTAMASVSELRLLDILSAEEFEKVLPLVSVLPADVGINMNTVSAGVVRALADDISEADASGFVNSRSKNGFAEMEEITKMPLFKNRLKKSIEGSLTLKSSYFSVYTRARYRDMTYYMHSRLARDAEGKVKVISREVGQFPRWVQTLRESVR